MYRYRVHPDLVTIVGSPPEGATHWGLQRRKPGQLDDRKGWSSLVFAEDDDGVCRHERPVADLTLDAIRDVSDGAGGSYRLKWMSEDEDGVPKQMSMGKHFTLAPVGGVTAPAAAPARRAAPAPAPAAPVAPDMMGFMLQMLAADRENARNAQERSDRESREAREDARRREEREREEAKRRDDREREARDRAWELEKLRMTADIEARAKNNELLSNITRALEAQSARVEQLAARLDEEEDDEPEEPSAPEGDQWGAIARDLVPTVKRGAEALLNHITQPGGAAE